MNGLALHHFSDRGVFRLQHLDGRGHVNGCFRFADRQAKLQPPVLSDLEPDSVLGDRESGGLRLDSVLAGGETRDLKSTGWAGLRCADCTGFRAARPNLCVKNRIQTGVRNHSVDRRQVALRREQRTTENESR